MRQVARWRADHPGMSARHACVAVLLVALALGVGLTVVRSLPGPAASLVPFAAEAAGEDVVLPAVGISSGEDLGEGPRGTGGASWTTTCSSA